MLEIESVRKHNPLDEGAVDAEFYDIPDEPEVKPNANPEPEGPKPAGGSPDALPPPEGPDAPPSKSKIFSGRNVLGGGFVAFDAYSRIKDGENAVVATGKALATNALFSALPGGLVGGIALTAGVTVASMAPEMYDGVQAAKSNLSKQGQAFNTSFEESEAQVANREAGMRQQRQSEQYALDVMRNHARSKHTSY